MPNYKIKICDYMGREEKIYEVLLISENHVCNTTLVSANFSLHGLKQEHLGPGGGTVFMHATQHLCEEKVGKGN